MFNKIITSVSVYLTFIIAMSIVLGAFGATPQAILTYAGIALAIPIVILFLFIIGGVEISYNEGEKNGE